MTAKKTEDVIPDGSVQIESVHHLEGFDPFAQIPEIATWRDYSPEALAAAEKAEKAADHKPASKKES